MIGSNVHKKGRIISDAASLVDNSMSVFLFEDYNSTSLRNTRFSYSLRSNFERGLKTVRMALEVNIARAKIVHVLPHTTHAKIDEEFNILTE